jgi:hypothetical protein
MEGEDKVWPATAGERLLGASFPLELPADAVERRE